jgi:hypothetical protein
MLGLSIYIVVQPLKVWWHYRHLSLIGLSDCRLCSLSCSTAWMQQERFTNPIHSQSACRNLYANNLPSMAYFYLVSFERPFYIKSVRTNHRLISARTRRRKSHWCNWIDLQSIKSPEVAIHFCDLEKLAIIMFCDSLNSRILNPQLSRPILASFCANPRSFSGNSYTFTCLQLISFRFWNYETKI